MPATILLVDDEDLIREVVAETLRDFDYEVITAADGELATAIIASGLPFDLLMTDVHMPGSIDGWGVAAQVRKSNLPVIVASGRPFEDARWAMRGPRFHLIQKPYRVSEIARMIRRMLAPGFSGPTVAT